MFTVIRMECRKAVGNRWFVLALSVGCVLSIISAIGCLRLDLEQRPFLDFISTSHYFPPSTLSVFGYWIVNDISEASTDLFFLLLPLLSVIPYSWSLLSDRTSGYIAHIVSRSSRVRYYVSKCVATSVSGALVVTVPLLLNFLLCMCFSPFYIPDATAVTVTGIFEESLWSGYYYTNPGLYCVLRTLLIAAFAGLWSSMVMVLSFFVKHRIPLLIVPFLSLILLKFFNGYVTVMYLKEDLVPFSYLRSVSTTGYLTSWWVIAIEFTLMLAIVVLAVMRNRKGDIL